jgi:hypothetical protein
MSFLKVFINVVMVFITFIKVLKIVMLAKVVKVHLIIILLEFLIDIFCLLSVILLNHSYWFQEHH